MISFSLERVDPATCMICGACVRKGAGKDFCNNFCRLNERLTYACPFCGKENIRFGAKPPVVCAYCLRDTEFLYEMSKQNEGMDLRIGHHLGYSNHAKTGNK